MKRTTLFFLLLLVTAAGNSQSVFSLKMLKSKVDSNAINLFCHLLYDVVHQENKNAYWVYRDSNWCYPPPFWHKNITSNFGTKNFFKPTLLDMNKLSDDTYSVKVAFSGVIDTDKIAIKEVVNVVWHYYPELLILESPFLRNTAYWRNVQKKNIRFIIDPQKDFNALEADSLLQFNQFLEKTFNVHLDSINYYSCLNKATMLSIQGLDYGLETVFDPDSKSGVSFAGFGIIISGGNTENYRHELVHLYTAEVCRDTQNFLSLPPSFVQEGIATFFGGTNLRSLEENLGVLKLMIDSLNIQNLDELRASPYFDDDGYTNDYLVGAVVAKLIFQRFGIKGIKDYICESRRRHHDDVLTEKLGEDYKIDVWSEITKN